MPNEFWPDTPQPPVIQTVHLGNEIQQKTAANNPDIFCKMQGSGYRLPSIGEFIGAARSISPGSVMQPQSPGHWSQFINNDTTKAKLPNDSSRSTNGALYNEWGDVSKYSNGWEVNNYWATELGVQNNTNFSSSLGRFDLGYGRGRFQFTPNGSFSIGTFPFVKNDTSGTTYSNYSNTLNVACVRDLVPTPSTPTPSKS